MFVRYAIYYTAKGAFADQGAGWLGWDVARGVSVRQPQISGIDLPKITARAVKYGFHGTIKAPFFLAKETREAELQDAFVQFCQAASAAPLEGLDIALLGRFLAFVPKGDVTQLRALAAGAVRDLDAFRAPASQTELARRRKANLSPAQELNLVTWGYPHVMESFRFHMTLTGPLQRDQITPVQAAANAYFKDALPERSDIDALSLVGERADGRWQVITRRSLGVV